MADLRGRPARRVEGRTRETAALADFQARLAEFWKGSASFRNRRYFARSALEAATPILRRGKPGLRLEGPIERPDRAEAGVERDCQDRHAGLGRIAQRGLGFREAIAVDEGAEIAMAEL